MGISRFYRWISERYPQINEVVGNGNTPIFDNFYLDVNGIAHNSINNNEMTVSYSGLNLSFGGSPEIWTGIFKYISRLVNIVKPKKVVYIAVDGVAPRAKMNQQRSRRFRSARDAALMEELAVRNSEFASKANTFDSNCITPGTSFMCELNRQLKFFVHYQIQNDPIWRDLEVILSGSDIPGEGEHKIMDYIRCIKSQPDYNNNTRHCLYGLDADLIMLSLASHEPHFSLLREEIKFVPSKVLDNRVIFTKDKFQFLHISILREYLVRELNPIYSVSKLDLNVRYMKEMDVRDIVSGYKDESITATTSKLVQSSFNINLDFKMDEERLIDDFIFLGYIVGNDFLPHIPFHTVDNGLDRILCSYRNYLASFHQTNFCKAPWLLEDCGRINFCNFLRFLVWHTRSEYEEAKKLLNSSDYWASVIPKNSKSNDIFGLPKFSKSLSVDKDNLRFQWQAKRPITLEEMRWRYYFVKMGIDANQIRDNNIDLLDNTSISESKQDELVFETLEDLVFCYLEGLQWVSYYYFRGTPSWSWFYSYRYAPYACDIAAILNHWLKLGKITRVKKSEMNLSMESDILNIEKMYKNGIHLNNMVFQYVLGIPLQPFEQLMGVLPSRSLNLLPKPFRRLFMSKKSPVIDYYPSQFDIDMEGIKVPWGGITLIPFIDEGLLLKSISYVLSNSGFRDPDFLNFNSKCEVATSNLPIHKRCVFLLEGSSIPTKYVDLEFQADTSEINESEYLTLDEKNRNMVGELRIYFYDECISGADIESTVPFYMPSLLDCKVASKIYLHPKFLQGTIHFPNKLLEGTIIPFDGFPSFSRLNFESFFGLGVNIFGSESKNESLYFSVSSKHISKEWIKELLETPPNMLLNRSSNICILVDYPRVHTAEIVSLKTQKYTVKPRLLLPPMITLNEEPDELHRALLNERGQLKRRGITLQYDGSCDFNLDKIFFELGSYKDNRKTNIDVENKVILDPIPENCLVEVRLAEEYNEDENGIIHYKFSNRTRYFLLPLIMNKRFIGNSSRYEQKVGFYAGARVLCLNKYSECFGHIGYILEENSNMNNVLSKFQMNKKSFNTELFQKKIFEYALRDLKSIQWFSIQDAAKILYKPLIACLKKGGMSDILATKYMYYSTDILNKLIMGPIFVKCHDRSLHDISMILFSEDKRQKIKLCLPLYSQYTNRNSYRTAANTIIHKGTPIISNESIKYIKEYIETFQLFVFAIFRCFVNLSKVNIEKSLDSPYDLSSDREGSVITEVESNERCNENTLNENQKVTSVRRIHVKEIFTNIAEPKDQDFAFNQAIRILKKQIYRKVAFVHNHSNGVSILPSTIQRLEKLTNSLNFEDNKENSKCIIEKGTKFLLHELSHCFSSLLNKFTNHNGLTLGLRIVYIRGNGGVVPFGSTGTIVATCSGIRSGRDSFKTPMVEVLLDRCCVNATNLGGKCSNLRGIIVPAWECIPLSPYLSSINTKDHISSILECLNLISNEDSKDKYLQQANKRNSSGRRNYWNKAARNVESKCDNQYNLNIMEQCSSIQKLKTEDIEEKKQRKEYITKTKVLKGKFMEEFELKASNFAPSPGSIGIPVFGKGSNFGHNSSTDEAMSVKLKKLLNISDKNKM
ncbi:XRN 5'-3' exonuclease domain-containing protein [Cryptosporidium serpentis]